MKHYREIIRDLREDKDLTQAEIATVLGTTQQHYSKYENGVYELPIRALTLLADYYAVPTDYILGRKGYFSEIPGLRKRITAEHTAEEFLNSILSLNAKSRADVFDYIYMQKLKEADEKKKKDGPRP
ncbi:MAG: helix-turn-helix domain-containing protein [Oscillospiraceae bacterium]|jgi:transcriptional regulator with XRE-family HTH domain|nr:helix-turn-helix domain-containing protein [Oscillospiraceae bacterium]